MAARSRSPRRKDGAVGEDGPERTLDEQYALALAEEAKELASEAEKAGDADAPSTTPAIGSTCGTLNSMNGMVGQMMMPMGAMSGITGGMGAMPGMMNGMGAMAGMMGGMGAMPGVVGGMGAMPGAMPGTLAMGAMPTAGMGAMPGMMGAIPGMMGGMGAMPAGMTTIPGAIGAMSGMMGAMPGAMGAMPGMAAMPGMMTPMGAMPGMMAGMPSMTGMGAMPTVGSMDAVSTQQSFKDMESAMSQKIHAAASSLSTSGAAEAPTSSTVGLSKNNPMHPAYRPEGTEPLLGITNRRFDGTIRMFLDNEGYGFIKSTEFEKLWEGTGRPKNDVFFHRNQKGPFGKGDTVNFAVYLNFKGKPQGTDFRRPGDDSKATD